MAWPLVRRQTDLAAREARREQAAVRRRQVAGQLAAAALSWGLTVWLEGAMWLCLAGGLAVDYIGSYADLAATFGAFGYDGWVRWIMPLGIDLPVTASVLGQLLAGRWRCGWWVRVRLGVLTATTAPLTLAGNALRGAIDGSGHFTFQVQLWMDLAAFAVPGLGVVLIGWVAAMMQGERAELTRRRLEGEAEAAAAGGADPAPKAGRRPGAPDTIAAVPATGGGGADDPSRDREPVTTLARERSSPQASAAGSVPVPMTAVTTAGGDRQRAAPAATQTGHGRSRSGHEPDKGSVIEKSAGGHDGDRERDPSLTGGWPGDDPQPGHVGVQEDDRDPATVRPSGDRGEDRDEVTAMTAEEARLAVLRLVRRSRRSGRPVTAAEVERVTGRGPRQARRLLKQATAEADPDSRARRPRVLGNSAAPAAAVQEA